jgi:hypothetical protein
MNSVFKNILLIFIPLLLSVSCTEAISIVDEFDTGQIQDIKRSDAIGSDIEGIYQQDIQTEGENESVDTSNLSDVEEIPDIININEDPDNCGSVGYRCSEHLNLPDMNAYPSSILCVAGSCVVGGCIDGRADCNNKFEDGCETYTGNDTDNCGYCGYKCSLNNAISDCQFSNCSLVSCIKPFANCDNNIQNGCETDTSKDINNCGMCHKECKYNNAYAECIDSKCIFKGCREGFVDLNKDIRDGCEYQCTPSNNGVEICDGIDNNCDGFIDENCSCNSGDRLPCGFNAGRCKAGYYECINGKWDTTCKGAIFPVPEECNGIDDDCNGETDEGLFRECQGSDAYLCNSPCGTGYEFCENGVWKRYNPPQPSKEICNGKDDDCNGLIDDGVASCPADMVPVGLCLCIDRFEASRPDATDTFTGTNNSYATSRPNVLPWTDVDWYTADKACKAAGKRLCSADEWRLACQGAGGYTYPYGNTYNPAICNGSDDPNPGNVFPTGKYSECKSPYGAFDMSGNVEEWNSTDYPDGKKGLRGGSYLNGNELYTKCAYEAPPVKPDFSSRTIGFRCCKTP